MDLLRKLFGQKPTKEKFLAKKIDARVSQDEIGSVYDKLAPLYDLWVKLMESQARDRAIDLAAIQDGQIILEVAVGTGFAFYEIVKRNPNGHNIGIDISEAMVKKANSRLKKLSGANFSINLGTALDLPLQPKTVDLLVNNYMFDLIAFEDMDKILAEFKRVLKMGGSLVLVNMTPGTSLGSKLYNFIYRLSPKSMGGCRGVGMKEMLEHNGFTVEVREYYQQMFFPSEVILAHKRA